MLVRLVAITTSAATRFGLAAMGNRGRRFSTASSANCSGLEYAQRLPLMTANPQSEFRRVHPNPHGAFESLHVLIADVYRQPTGLVVAEEPLAILAPGTRRQLRIFHFNDLHNYLTLPDTDRGDTHLFAQIVRRYRSARAAAADAEIVLLVSGGDDHTGTVLDELLGWSPDELIVDPAYHAYSAAGVEIAAIGNHDLDRGAALLAAGIRRSAAFPLLAANLHGSRHLIAGRDYVPAAIAVAKGLRIGFIGLLTPIDTRVHPADDPGLAVASPLAVLRNVLPIVAASSDVLVVMSHCGYGTDRRSEHDDGIERVLAEGDVALARAAARLTPKPLVVVGAHSHTVLNAHGLDATTLIDGVPIVQAGGQGSHVGEFQITITIGGDRAASTPRARLHRLKRCGNPADPQTEQASDFDAEFELRVIAPLLARVSDRLDEVLGKIVAGDDMSPATTQRQRYMGECALANFITDALVVRGAEFAQGPVDLAIVNSTAIATGLALGRGARVTFKQWFAVLPFADTLQVAQVTGAELAAILDNNVKRVVRPDELTASTPVDLAGYVARGFLQFSAGVRYTLWYGPSAKDAHADRVIVFGQPLSGQLDRVFRVALTNYIGAGGYGECWNGAPIPGVPGALASVDVRRLPQRDTGLGLRSEVTAFIRANGGIRALLDGRVVVA